MLRNEKEEHGSLIGTAPSSGNGEKGVICRLKRKVSGVPIWIEVHGTKDHVHEIVIGTGDGKLPSRKKLSPSTPLARQVEREIDLYLADPQHKIDLPLWQHADRNTQVAAMGFLCSIPAGETRSYAQQAQAVRKACGGGFNARNAGTANRNNHYPLAIPCHRVVRTSGDVGGFMGTTRAKARELKMSLLRHEGAC